MEMISYISFFPGFKIRKTEIPVKQAVNQKIYQPREKKGKKEKGKALENGLFSEYLENLP